MRIGELAEATGTPVETIRFYEREGLLPRPRARRTTTACTWPPTPSGWPSSANAATWT